MYRVVTFSMGDPIMPKLVNVLPKYRRHRKSGQAVVTIHGRDFYLGKWRSKRVAKSTTAWSQSTLLGIVNHHHPNWTNSP